MPTFEAANSREQRGIASNWHGTPQLHDVTYDVSYSVLDKKPKQLVSFASSTGHMPLNDAHSSAPDLFYNNVVTIADRLKYGKPKGAVAFNGMASGHPDGTERNPKDRRNVFLGVGQTTLELVDVDLKFRFARPLSRGTNYCNFSKMPTREQREHVAMKGTGLSSLNQSGLHIKYSAVDKNTPAVVFRPASAASSSCGASAARRRDLQGGSEEGSRLSLYNSRSRPNSALAGAHCSESEGHRRTSVSPEGGGGEHKISGEYTISTGGAGGSNEMRPTSAGSRSPTGAHTADDHHHHHHASSRPGSSCSRNCTAKAFEALFAAKVAAEKAKKQHSLESSSTTMRKTTRQQEDLKKPPLLVQEGGGGSPDVGGITLFEAIDPLRAFNASRRSVARPATFSKAKRRGIYDG